MEQLVLISGSIALILALLDQVGNLGKLRAPVALITSGIGSLVLVSDIKPQIFTWLAAAFFGPFLAAIAGRITLIPLAVTREVGQPRQM